jgi:hypothetical protein
MSQKKTTKLLLKMILPSSLKKTCSLPAAASRLTLSRLATARVFPSLRPTRSVAVAAAPVPADPVPATGDSPSFKSVTKKAPAVPGRGFFYLFSVYFSRYTSL